MSKKKVDAAKLVVKKDSAKVIEENSVQNNGGTATPSSPTSQPGKTYRNIVKARPDKDIKNV